MEPIYIAAVLLKSCRWQLDINKNQEGGISNLCGQRMFMLTRKQWEASISAGVSLQHVCVSREIQDKAPGLKRVCAPHEMLTDRWLKLHWNTVSYYMSFPCSIVLPYGFVAYFSAIYIYFAGWKVSLFFYDSLESDNVSNTPYKLHASIHV